MAMALRVIGKQRQPRNHAFVMAAKVHVMEEHGR
jgi:hypothetical protein